jgi:hypothetical protein
MCVACCVTHGVHWCGAAAMMAWRMMVVVLLVVSMRSEGQQDVCLVYRSCIWWCG